MSEIRGIPTGASDAAACGDRLDSWKEIATYLKRDVRTVQRWERRSRLPIHRLQHETQGTVFAYRSEIDKWLRSHQHSDAQKRPSLNADHGRRTFWIAIAGVVILILIFIAQVSQRRAGSFRTVIPRQLTANASDNRILSAAVSPDGKYLAYSDNSGILLRHIDTGDVRSLPSTTGLYVQNWFPDGSTLLASRYTDPSLWVVSVMNGASHKVQDDAAAGAVSPDGLHVAFWRNGASELWVMGPTGENPKKIVTTKSSEILADFTWSPNGKRLAYVKVHRGDGTDEITVETHDLSGNDRTVILSDRRLEVGGGTGLAWLPDGRLIFSLQNLTSGQMDNNLWAVTTDISTGRATGEPTQVTALSGFLLLYLTRSADGRRVVFLKAREQFGIYVAKLEGNARRLGETKRLTLDNWNSVPNAWTSDGRAILFESDRNGHPGLFKQLIDRDASEAIPVGAGTYHRPTAAYNNAWFLFWDTPLGKDVRSSRLMRIDVPGGPAVEVLTASGNASHNCAFRPANSCVLGEQFENQLVLSGFDPARGRGDELGRMDLNGPDISWSLSPDGERVALGERKRIRILDLKTGTTQDFVPRMDLKDLTSIAWSADGKGLFWSISVDMKTLVFYSDLTGRARQLTEYDGWIGNLVPSPDGAHLAFAQTTQEVNAAMIENF